MKPVLRRVTLAITNPQPSRNTPSCEVNPHSPERWPAGVLSGLGDEPLAVTGAAAEGPPAAQWPGRGMRGSRLPRTRPRSGPLRIVAELAQKGLVAGAESWSAG